MESANKVLWPGRAGLEQSAAARNELVGRSNTPQTGLTIVRDLRQRWRGQQGRSDDQLLNRASPFTGHVRLSLASGPACRDHAPVLDGRFAGGDHLTFIGNRGSPRSGGRSRARPSRDRAGLRPRHGLYYISNV